jgi:hypothetical protein
LVYRFCNGSKAGHATLMTVNVTFSASLCPKPDWPLPANPSLNYNVNERPVSGSGEDALGVHLWVVTAVKLPVGPSLLIREQDEGTLRMFAPADPDLLYSAHERRLGPQL